MIKEFIRDAANGKSVFITDVRKSFSDLPEGEQVLCILLLPDGTKKKYFEIRLPNLFDTDSPQLAFLQSYLEAEIYNVLTTLGGARLDIYFDKKNMDLKNVLEKTIVSFGVDQKRSERSGYGRVINVIDRMLTALDSPDGKKKFEIMLWNTSEFPGIPAEFKLSASPNNIFREVTKNLEDKIICGLDIGGTDIKAAVAVHGELVGLKEYDWNPAAYKNVEDIIDPIVAIARLMRSIGSLSIADDLDADNRSNIETALHSAMSKNATYLQIRESTNLAEGLIASHLVSYDAIGLCFPDVVIKSKIVGGEVPKTVGMRGNKKRDFEEQFSLLTDLDVRLGELCTSGRVVMNTNDGPMAAFAAAVELAASPEAELVSEGVFAHTLGTDLGTGLVLADGTIPEIPMEVYNLIVDLGSEPAKKYKARDMRSLNNLNTALPGTLQRFASQTGAFRLAAEYFSDRRPELYNQLIDRGFISRQESEGREMLCVPEIPNDMRKPFLSHLMAIADHGGDDETTQIFRQIGMYLSVVWEETEHILKTGLSARFLFGRLVKVQRCFDLMQEGAAERTPDLKLIAADSEMAFTPLMRRLAADEEYTVAQFGQAVGAIYFGNLGIQNALH